MLHRVDGFGRGSLKAQPVEKQPPRAAAFGLVGDERNARQLDAHFDGDFVESADHW